MLEDVFLLCKGNESLEIRKAGGISAVSCLYIGGKLNRGWCPKIRGTSHENPGKCGWWHTKWDTCHIY